jgi:hypothetical protein
MRRRRRRRDALDPIALEDRLIEHGLLPDRIEDPSLPGADERHFTERDPRMNALWRIGLVRQFHPRELRQMGDDDLVFLGGQSATGYESLPATHGIDLASNKTDQNATRARLELDTRARRAMGRQSAIIALCGVLLGSVLTIVTDHLFGR